MSKIVDLKAPPAPEIARRVKRLETADFGGYTSVNEGTFRVASDEGLLVEGSERITGQWFLDGVGEVTGSLSIFGGPEGAGSLYANGTVDFEGTFTAAGTNLLTGTNRLIGPTSVEGQLTSTGDVFLNGTTRINGDTFITKTLSITGATKVQASFEALGDTILGGTLRVNAATEVHGAFRTYASARISGSLRTDSNFDAVGTTTLGGTVNISGATTLSSTLTVNGAVVAGGVRIESDQITVAAGSNSTRLNSSGITASYATIDRVWLNETMLIPGVVSVTDLQSSDEWLIRRSNQIMAVPQSVGGPMGDLEWPFDPSTISDGFGPRVSPGGIGSTDHKGVDFTLNSGTPIPSAGSGTVVFAGGNPSVGWGYYVRVDHGRGIETLYAHMESSPSVSVGQRVSRKQILGEVGSTGTSTGPHLHMEVWQNGTQIDPEGYITKPWTG